jgi:hypothetical protein
VEFKTNALTYAMLNFMYYLSYWLMKWLVLNICVLLVEGSVIILFSFLHCGTRICRFDVFISQMMKMNIINLTNEIFDPID